MVGHPAGARWQNQRTPSDNDTVVLADDANWAANNSARAGYASEACKCLRAVGCLSEMIDQIGGWSSGKVGESYGEGYELGQLHAHLEHIMYSSRRGTLNS